MEAARLRPHFENRNTRSVVNPKGCVFELVRRRVDSAQFLLVDAPHTQLVLVDSRARGNHTAVELFAQHFERKYKRRFRVAPE